MPNQNPEQLARDRIDAALRQCGWTIQDKKKINLTAALGVAIHAERDQMRLAVHTSAICKLHDAPNQENFDDAWQFITHNFSDLYTVWENVAELRKAILQLAVMEKLVPQKLNEGTAGELLEKIFKEKRNEPKKDKNNIEIFNYNKTQIKGPFVIPDTWEWVKLSDVSIKIHFGYTASADFSKTDVRLLRITDIQDNKVDWASVPGCDAIKVNVSQYLLNNNDMLIARTGGTVGKSYLVSNIHVDAVFASYLIRVVPSKYVDVNFIKYFADSPLYWNQLLAAFTGTGQPNVNGTSLSELRLSLPPLQEQKRITARITEILSLCANLEKQIGSVQDKKGELLRAMMGDVVLS